MDGAFGGPAAPEVISIMTKYSLTNYPNVYKVTTPPAIDPNGRLNIDSMRKDWQFFKDTRQTDDSVTVDQVVDEFRRAGNGLAWSLCKEKSEIVSEWPLTPAHAHNLRKRTATT